MKNNNGLEKFSEIISKKSVSKTKKPPTYEWQDLALKVIEDLNIPGFKRNSIFKACKEFPKGFILSCLNDTKELCKKGDKWKYFFKLIGSK